VVAIEVSVGVLGEQLEVLPMSFLGLGNDLVVAFVEAPGPGLHLSQRRYALLRGWAQWSEAEYRREVLEFRIQEGRGSRLERSIDDGTVTPRIMRAFCMRSIDA
jgi:hypothetical protein